MDKRNDYEPDGQMTETGPEVTEDDQQESVETGMNIKIIIDNQQNEWLLDNAPVAEAWEKILQAGVRKMVNTFLALHGLKADNERIEYDDEYYQGSTFFYDAHQDPHHFEVSEIIKNLCSRVKIRKYEFHEMQDHIDVYAVTLIFDKPYATLHEFLSVLSDCVTDTPYKLPQGFNISDDQSRIYFSLRRRPSPEPPKLQ